MSTHVVLILQIYVGTIENRVPPLFFDMNSIFTERTRMRHCHQLAVVTHWRKTQSSVLPLSH